MSGFLIFVAILLSALSYLAVPIVYRIFVGSSKKAWLISVLNALVVFLFWFFMDLLFPFQHETVLTDMTDSSHVRPAIFYAIIGVLILQDYRKKTSKTIITKKLFCPKCGKELLCGQKKCAICGEKLCIKDNIKIIQNWLVILPCFLIHFAFFQCMAITSYNDECLRLESMEKQQIKLSDLNPTDRVYCVFGASEHQLYVKADTEFIKYSFENKNRYDNKNKEYAGRATFEEIKSYFGDSFISGKPQFVDLVPQSVPFGISFLCIFVLLNIILSFFIHRMAEEEIYKLSKTNETFTALRIEYKNDNLRKSEYRRLLKETFSKDIMKNKGIHRLFKVLY